MKIISYKNGDSVIPAVVKMPDNKFARIIKPGKLKRWEKKLYHMVLEAELLHYV